MDDLSRARLLAVEILLADPEALRNDALEADLYLLVFGLWDLTCYGNPRRLRR